MKARTLATRITLVLAALTPPTLAQNNIWMSRAEALQCPMTGPLWDALVSDANRNIVPNVDNMDDDSDAYTLAAALVWLRLPDSPPFPAPPVQPKAYYRDKIATICDVVSSSPPFTHLDAKVRNPLGYILAADIIDLPSVNPTIDAHFRSWIASWLPDVRNVHSRRPNNQGLFAGATRVAAGIYTGDTTGDEALAWDIFRQWLGEGQGPYQRNDWGGGVNPSSPGFTAWQAEDFPFFYGINHMGTVALDCDEIPRDVDGVLPDDQRRGDCSGCGWDCSNPVNACPPEPESCKFTWPCVGGSNPDFCGPVKTNYAYTALQGALAQAVIHYRRGRDPWTIPMDALGQRTDAIKRAFLWLRDKAHHPVNDIITNGTCDLWQAYIANRLYPGLGLFEDLNTPVPPGFQVGYADWTTRSPTWP